MAATARATVGSDCRSLLNRASMLAMLAVTVRLTIAAVSRMGMAAGSAHRPVKASPAATIGTPAASPISGPRSTPPASRLIAA